jgi:hypothetical protein
VRRRNAFWPALINPEENLADEIIAAIERVPGKVPILGQAITGAIALWTPTLGADVLLHLFALARMARAPDLITSLRRFVTTHYFATPEGERLLATAFELICLLGQLPGAEPLLDDIRHDHRLWRPQFAPGWLRAKVRLGSVSWIEAMCALKPEFAAIAGGMFDLQRFLDRLLDDLLGLRHIAMSVEAFMTDGGVMNLKSMTQQAWLAFGSPRPWFFEAVFTGEDAPIEPVVVDGSYCLRRVRPFGPDEPPLVLTSLGTPEETVYRLQFWQKVTPFRFDVGRGEELSGDNVIIMQQLRRFTG